jgi:hypothetical protein
MSETVWIVIAESDLNDYLVGAQMDALKNAALASGQTNPFARVMQDVASRVRAEVRACRTNKVSALANSVPPDLKSSACNLIIEVMQGRLAGAGALPLTEDQKDACREARDYLKRIAECKVPIAQPSDPDTANDIQVAGSIEATTAAKNSKRVTTRDRLQGL